MQQKSQEQIKKEIEMFELLGIYYDSDILIEDKVADEASFEMTINDCRFSDGFIGISWDFLITCGDNKRVFSATDYNLKTNIFATINSMENNFYIGSNEIYNTELRINDKKYEYSGYSLGTKEIFNQIKELILTISLSELKNKLKITGSIKRKTDILIRKQYFDKRKGYANPEDYFKSACSVETSGTKSRYRFKGIIKDTIAQSRKETMLFFIDYLYGFRLNKNENIGYILNFLEKLPYNDFGIKDVAKMRKLAKMSKYLTVAEAYKQLSKILKPAKPELMKRWNI